MNNSLQAVHRVLEYLLTKAALTGQLKGTKVRIPYNELTSAIGNTKFRETDLIVKIDFEWDETRGKVKDIVAESLKDEFSSEETEDDSE